MAQVRVNRGTPVALELGPRRHWTDETQALHSLLHRRFFPGSGVAALELLEGESQWRPGYSTEKQQIDRRLRPSGSPGACGRATRPWCCGAPWSARRW